MPFDNRVYRDAMGQFATGVVVVTGLEAEQLVGFVAQSFVSLSLDPPLVAVCPAKTSTSWPRIRTGEHFGVNVLVADQGHVSDAFARPGEIADIGWKPGAHGVPILDDVLASVECSLEAEHDAGDHTIAVGRVLDFHVARPDADPLVFFRGGYGIDSSS